MHFEFDGEKYKKASRHQKEWGNQLIQELDLQGNEVVLDLGCGDGVLTAQLAAQVPQGHVIGLDASAGMIETANQLTKDNLSFVCTDINDLDYSSKFDVIFSNAALHWILDHTKLLNHAYRALKPNGILKWNFAGAGTCTVFNETMKIMMKDDMYQKYFSDFIWPWFMPSKEEYDLLISAVGFRSFNIELQNKDRYFLDRDELIRWIDQPSIVPFIGRIPDTFKEQFRSQVIDRMIEKTLQPDGRCFETFKRIHLEAVK